MYIYIYICISTNILDDAINVTRSEFELDVSPYSSKIKNIYNKQVDAHTVSVHKFPFTRTSSRDLSQTTTKFTISTAVKTRAVEFRGCFESQR